MIPVCRPETPVELALVESVLISYQIPYFVHNKHFSSLYPGVQIDLLNVRTVMVSKSYELEAKQALADLMISFQEEEIARAPKDIMRMLFEVSILGWLFPVKKRKT